MINRRTDHDHASSGPSGSKVLGTDASLASVDNPRKGKSVLGRKPRWEKFPELILRARATASQPTFAMPHLQSVLIGDTLAEVDMAIDTAERNLTVAASIAILAWFRLGKQLHALFN